MTNPVIDKYGTQCWYNSEKEYHREDGPAIIWDDGSEEWRMDDKFHRIDGPAVIRADGKQYWWVNGHRKNNNKSFQKAAKLTDVEMTALILRYGNIK